MSMQYSMKMAYFLPFYRQDGSTKKQKPHQLSGAFAFFITDRGRLLLRYVCPNHADAKDSGRLIAARGLEAHGHFLLILH